MERKISKSVTRKINTAQYENVTITVSVEEQISEKSEKEIDNKLKSLTDQLIIDYKITEGMVFDELQLENKPAYIESAKLPKNTNVDFKEIFD